MKITEPIEAASGIRATCPTCGKVAIVSSLSVASQITNHGCQDCRDKEFEGGEMAKAIVNTGQKTTSKKAAKGPTLVKGKGNGKAGDNSGDEHPAVKRAKAKDLEVEGKLPGMDEAPLSKNEMIEKYAIQRKKVSREKVLLMAEEKKLEGNIRALMKDLGLTHYTGEEVEVEIKSTQDKLIINLLDEENDKD
jgi:hypothetical protein